MRAEPGQANGQRDVRCGSRMGEMNDALRQQKCRDDEAEAIDEGRRDFAARPSAARQSDGQKAHAQKRDNAPKCQGHGSPRFTLSAGTPREFPFASADRILSSPRDFHADAAAAVLAHRAFADQFDSRRVERADQLGQRIDRAADNAVARLHPLDGGQRQVCELRELALVETEQRPRGFELGG